MKKGKRKEVDEIVGITHIGLAVPDLEQAMEWYIDVLGFELIAGPYSFDILAFSTLVSQSMTWTRQQTKLPEQAAVDEAPSMIAVMGRYVLEPSIFDILETLDRGGGNEIQLTDALRKRCAQAPILAVCLDGERYDISDKFGYLRASIEMALERPKMRSQLLSYLERLQGKLVVN